MLALPITNDQPGVAARLANKKVGVVISPDQASPATFVAAIKRVLGDSTFRDNVRRVQEAIRSTNGPSIAAGILERALSWSGGSRERPNDAFMGHDLSQKLSGIEKILAGA